MQKISYIILLFFLFLQGILGAYAQDDQDKKNKEQELKSERIAFFTTKIGLTPDEAQIFWPLYNSYWEEKNKIIASRKENMTFFAGHSSEMSNEEMIKYADQYIRYEMELAQLIDVYHVKFKKILPIDKVMKIYMADYEYKTFLLKKLKEKGKTNTPE